MAKNLTDLLDQIENDPNLKDETKKSVRNLVESAVKMNIDTQNPKEKGADINIIEVTGNEVPNPVRGAMFTKKTNTPFVSGEWLKADTIALIAAVLAKNGQTVANPNPEVKKQKKSSKLVTALASLALALGITVASLIPFVGKQVEKDETIDNTNYIVQLQEAIEGHEISMQNFSEDIMTPFDGTSVEEAVDACVKKETKNGLKCNSYDEYVQKLSTFMSSVEKQIESGSITNEEAKELLEDFHRKNISIYTVTEAAHKSLEEAYKTHLTNVRNNFTKISSGNIK